MNLRSNLSGSSRPNDGHLSAGTIAQTLNLKTAVAENKNSADTRKHAGL